MCVCVCIAHMHTYVHAHVYVKLATIWFLFLAFLRRYAKQKETELAAEMTEKLNLVRNSQRARNLFALHVPPFC